MKTTALLPLYLRIEPSTDSYLLRVSAARRAQKRDVCAYHNQACTKLAARWPWHSTKPRRNARKVMFNCYQWQAVWLPDLKPLFAPHSAASLQSFLDAARKAFSQ